MVKRAALARTLALDPDILFLDEPAGLGPHRCRRIRSTHPYLRDALGFTVFLVTHDLDTLCTICDRVAVLSDKHVLAADKLDVVEGIETLGAGIFSRTSRACS